MTLSPAAKTEQAPKHSTRISGKTVNIYGDSIMRATILNDTNHYHSLMSNYTQRLFDDFSLKLVNRSRFGSTISKGKELFDRDLAKGLECDYALLEYGGNDCDFAWQEIAQTPDDEHLPKTNLETFISTLQTMADELFKRGVQPILMTLPPIDAERYLRFVGKDDISCKNIVHWLGDTFMIYRFQELYSNAICQLAAKRSLTLIDVRSRFLDKHNYKSELISSDGIHPSETGYQLIYDAFSDYICKEC